MDGYEDDLGFSSPRHRTTDHMAKIAIALKDANNLQKARDEQVLVHLSNIATMANWIALCAAVATGFLLYKLW